MYENESASEDFDFKLSSDLMPQLPSSQENGSCVVNKAINEIQQTPKINCSSPFNGSLKPPEISMNDISIIDDSQELLITSPENRESLHSVSSENDSSMYRTAYDHSDFACGLDGTNAIEDHAVQYESDQVKADIHPFFGSPSPTFTTNDSTLMEESVTIKEMQKSLNMYQEEVTPTPILSPSPQGHEWRETSNKAKNLEADIVSTGLQQSESGLKSESDTGSPFSETRAQENVSSALSKTTPEIEETPIINSCTSVNGPLIQPEILTTGINIIDHSQELQFTSSDYHKILSSNCTESDSNMYRAACDDSFFVLDGTNGIEDHVLPYGSNQVKDDIHQFFGSASPALTSDSKLVEESARNVYGEEMQKSPDFHEEIGSPSPILSPSPQGHELMITSTENLEEEVASTGLQQALESGFKSESNSGSPSSEIRADSFEFDACSPFAQQNGSSQHHQVGVVREVDLSNGNGHCNNSSSFEEDTIIECTPVCELDPGESKEEGKVCVDETIAPQPEQLDPEETKQEESVSVAGTIAVQPESSYEQEKIIAESGPLQEIRVAVMEEEKLEAEVVATEKICKVVEQLQELSVTLMEEKKLEPEPLTGQEQQPPLSGLKGESSSGFLIGTSADTFECDTSSGNISKTEMPTPMKLGLIDVNGTNSSSAQIQEFVASPHVMEECSSILSDKEMPKSLEVYQEQVAISPKLSISTGRERRSTPIEGTNWEAEAVSTILQRQQELESGFQNNSGSSEDLIRVARTSMVKKDVKPEEPPRTKLTTKPTSKPIAKSTLQPKAKPSTQTTTKPIIKTSTQLTARPLTKASTQPAAKPTSQPPNRPIAKAVAELISKPATRPITKVATRPITKVATQPATKPIVKLATRPITKVATQPATKPISKPATKPISKPATKPIPKPTAQPITKTAARLITKPASQLTTKPMTKAATRPLTKAATQQTTKPLPKEAVVAPRKLSEGRTSGWRV